jgi:hypothetical protein
VISSRTIFPRHANPSDSMDQIRPPLRKGALVALVILTQSLSLGCTPEYWNAVAQGLAASSPAVVQPSKLMLFAGEGHKTYLGCLSCSEYANDSVLNKYGPHGSAFSAESVMNKHSPYGGRHGAYSPCNPFSADPPIIVDDQGNSYGRLTINKFNSERTRNTVALEWLTSSVCE